MLFLSLQNRVLLAQCTKTVFYIYMMLNKHLLDERMRDFISSELFTQCKNITHISLNSLIKMLFSTGFNKGKWDTDLHVEVFALEQQCSLAPSRPVEGGGCRVTPGWTDCELSRKHCQSGSWGKGWVLGKLIYLHIVYEKGEYFWQLNSSHYSLKYLPFDPLQKKTADP